MDIVVISSKMLTNEEQRKQVTRVPVQKKRSAERRRNRTDRRKGVQEGVVVNLSYPNDRRKQPDRRR